MTAKGKAIELRDKFFSITMNSNLIDGGLERAKQCALIAVDELINHCSQVEPFLGVDYWNEVKSEIEKP